MEQIICNPAARAPWSKGKIVGPKVASKLRACDLVSLRVRDAIGAWIAAAKLLPESLLFPSRVRRSPHMSTRQYARIVESGVTQLGLDRASYGTHTLKRTKATLIYWRTKNLHAVQLLVRYLGIEVNDALEIAEQTDV